MGKSVGGTHLGTILSQEFRIGHVESKMTLSLLTEIVGQSRTNELEFQREVLSIDINLRVPAFRCFLTP